MSAESNPRFFYCRFGRAAYALAEYSLLIQYKAESTAVRLS